MAPAGLSPCIGRSHRTQRSYFIITPRLQLFNLEHLNVAPQNIAEQTGLHRAQDLAIVANRTYVDLQIRDDRLQDGRHLSIRHNIHEDRFYLTTPLNRALQNTPHHRRFARPRLPAEIDEVTLVMVHPSRHVGCPFKHSLSILVIEQVLEYNALYLSSFFLSTAEKLF